MDYRTFTASLSGLKGYYKEIGKINSKQEDLLYIMSGVRGLSFDQVIVHGSPSLSEEKRLELIDKYNAMEEKKNTLRKMAAIVENTLDRMPKELQRMLSMKYIEGKSYEHISAIYGYSINGLWHHMKRETEKYL